MSADRLPYTVRLNSWVPRVFGHDCVTLRRTIYCRNAVLPAHTHAHEYRHIEHWATLGVFGFLRRYLREQLRNGYQKNWYEIDARLYADTYHSEFGPLP